jgi:hypothetical protein
MITLNTKTQQIISEDTYNIKQYYYEQF